MFGTTTISIVAFLATITISTATLERGDFTYQASLRTYWTYHYCAGAIISDRWVLTSATCTVYSFFDINDAFVVVGGLDIYEGDSYACELIKKHDYFQFPKYEYDIALARTNTPMLLNQFVHPIPYYRGFTADRINNAVTIGWGWTWSNDGSMEQHLTYRNVTVISKSECASSWGTNFQPETLPYTTLCVNSEDDATRRNIEFGIPLATSDSRVLLGIYTGNSGDGYIRPDLYTGTADVANWIFQYTYVDGVTNF